MVNGRSYWLSFIAIVLLSCGGGGSSRSPATVVPTPNIPPVIVSSSSITVRENADGAFYRISASDEDSDTLSYVIDGGADESLFSITGPDISFLTPPDFDSPANADGDNIYQLEIGVSDGEASVVQDLLVTVTSTAGTFSLRRIASGLTQPLYVAGRGDGTDRIFIVEKGGQIKILDRGNGAISAVPFLDIASTISTNGERGLLGLALAPDYSTSGDFYVSVTNL